MMNHYITGSAIKARREEQGMTQVELAERIGVSDKTVSKWENGRGLPDITLLEPLASALNSSVIELMNGEFVTNRNRAANMNRLKFYVCPVCGNVIVASGDAVVSCCGISLPALEPEKGDGSEEGHEIHVDQTDMQLHVTMEHPMSKEHSISFIAYVHDGGYHLTKLYPEGLAEAWLPSRRHGWVYAYCNRHGLFRVRI